MTNILVIDSSGRHEGSHSRRLTKRVADRLGGTVTYRDVGDGEGFVGPQWIGGAYSPAADRTPEQRAALDRSDALVDELEAADVVVIGVPIYNFGVSAALKSWIDQICRANRTFKYSETGPVGLLEGKRAILVVTSGGTEVDGAVDFATPYMRHVLSFIGITDVEVVAADRLMMEGEEKVNLAYDAFEERLAA